jgi:hypothetical protein
MDCRIVLKAKDVAARLGVERATDSEGMAVQPQHGLQGDAGLQG